MIPEANISISKKGIDTTKGKAQAGSIESGLGGIAGDYGFDDIEEGGYGKCDIAAEKMVAYLKKISSMDL